MHDFIYTSHPSRVVFGAGSLNHLEREIIQLGAKRALVLSTPEQAAQAEAIAKRLGAPVYALFLNTDLLDIWVGLHDEE